MAKKKTNPATEVVELEKIEPIETVVEPVPVIGTVVGCKRLNVRKKSNIDSVVACTVDVGAELIVDVDQSTPDWYKVVTEAGVKGYCMKKYVRI